MRYKSIIHWKTIGRFEIYPGVIPGVKVIECDRIIDDRGWFVKTFASDYFGDLGFPLVFKDEFYSCSRLGVFRGFHFSVPPNEGFKLVSCVDGTVDDFLIDLRKSSSHYGWEQIIKLNADEPTVILIPPGVAHGFYALTDAIMTYKTTNPYLPEYDKGVRWDSVDTVIGEPILSDRDKGLPLLADFESPFK